MHPSPLELKRFATGELNETAAETIGLHLESCAQCDTRIAQFDESEDELLAGLTAARVDTASPSIELN